MRRDRGGRGEPGAGRFLADLRALRARAGLNHGELAARAHYPRDVIASAESGPALPALPVLAAYVRGCGGNGDEILAWEDRWRSVTGTPARPLRSARVAGSSGAASGAVPAGRAASGTGGSADSASPWVSLASGSPGAAALDGSNPAAILEALHRFGEQMSQTGPDASRDIAAAPPGDARAAVVPAVSGISQTPRTPEIPRAPRTPGTPRTSAAANVPRQPRRAAPRPQGNSSGVGQRRGASGRTLMIAAIAGVVLCLLVIMLTL